MYRQYMDDQEKQEREGQKASCSAPTSPPEFGKYSSLVRTFKERLREGPGDFFNVQKRLRRHRYAVKQGSPPPRRPPCCPHWDKAQPKTSKCRKHASQERLSVYEPGQRSRLERYEERLRDPTSKEARQKAAFEARFSSKATTVSGRPAELDTEMERISQRIREIERRNAVLVEASGVKLSRKRQTQSGKDCAGTYRYGHPATEGPGSGVRSLGTISLKGRDIPKNFNWNDSRYRQLSAMEG